MELPISPGIANENRNTINVDLDLDNDSPDEFIPSLTDFQRPRGYVMPATLPTIGGGSAIPTFNMQHPYLPQMPGLPGFPSFDPLNMNMSNMGNMSPKKDANATHSASPAVPAVLPIHPLTKDQRSKPEISAMQQAPPQMHTNQFSGVHPPHLPVFHGVNPSHHIHAQFLRPIPPQIPPVFRNETPRYNPYQNARKTDGKTKDTKKPSAPTLESISRDAQNSFVKNTRQSLRYLQHSDVQEESNKLQQKLIELKKTQQIQSKTNMNLNVGATATNPHQHDLSALARSISTPYYSPGSPSLRKIDENGMMATTPKEVAEGKYDGFLMEMEQKTQCEQKQEGKKDVDEEQKMNVNVNVNQKVTPSQKPIMSVVGGRVFVIPSIEEIVKNTNLLKPRDNRKEQAFRGYSVGGFSLRNDAKRRQMANMALKRSRTTFEPRRGRRCQGQMNGRNGVRNLQKLAIGTNESSSLKTVNSKTTKSSFSLLGKNDDLMKDPHVRSHVRKMLKGINLARRRSLSCGALMAVQE